MSNFLGLDTKNNFYRSIFFSALFFFSLQEFYIQSDYFLGISSSKSKIFLFLFILSISIASFFIFPRKKIKTHYLSVLPILAFSLSWYLVTYLKIYLVNFESYFILYHAIILSLISFLSKQEKIDFKVFFATFLASLIFSYFLPEKYELLKLTILLSLWIINFKKPIYFAGLFLLIYWGRSELKQEFPIFSEQKNYKELIKESFTTEKNKIVLTQWKHDYWLYANERLVLNSIDKDIFYEIMTIPALALAKEVKQVLVLGGENLEIIRKVKENFPKAQIDLVPEDIELYEALQNNEELQNLFPKTTNLQTNLVKQEITEYLESTTKKYDLIFSDLLDIKHPSNSSFKTKYFFLLNKKHLKENGIFISHTASPMFNQKLYQRLKKNNTDAGLEILSINKQMPSLGDWSWLLARPIDSLQTPSLRNSFNNIDIKLFNTKHLNVETLNALPTLSSPLLQHKK